MHMCVRDRTRAVECVLERRYCSFLCEGFVRKKESDVPFVWSAKILIEGFKFH